MSPAQAMALIVILSGLLAFATTAAGVFWWHSRSWPMVRAASLARELVDRQVALESLIERLESRLNEPGPRVSSATVVVPRGPSSRASSRRIHTAHAASEGPKLIAVPDLAVPPAPSDASGLGERFGEVWDLAEAGNSPEEIARRLGQPVGQVELILGLRRRVASGSRG